MCYQHRLDPDDLLAHLPETVKRPQDWGKAVSAAYLWLVTDEVRASAEGAGIGDRTLHRWIHSEWWLQACAEAQDRWRNHVVVESRRTLMRSIKGGNVDKAMDVLKQFDPEFRPRPKEVRVVGLLAFIQELPNDEVSRVMAMPEAERRIEVGRLASTAGLQLVG